MADRFSSSDDDGPDSIMELIRLGADCLERFEGQGNMKDIEKAVGCLSVAVALIPDNHPKSLSLLNNLGASYTRRFEYLGDLGDLQKSIECQSRSVSLTAEGHPHLPSMLSNLGVSYSHRFDYLGEPGDLEKSIECKSRAVSLIPEGHLDSPSPLSNLGVSYMQRFRRLGKMDDLEKAIQCHTRAVSLTPKGHPELPSLLRNLAVSYSGRFNRLGDLIDLEKAIESEGHPHFPSLLSNLGASYGNRFNRLGELGDLKKAIEYKSRAALLTAEGHPHFPSLLSTLGASYSDQFKRLGELGDLEKAIKCISRAVSLIPDGHPNVPLQLINLGVCYTQRFRRLGELGDLETAIGCKTRAISLIPEGHPDLPSLFTNLAASYGDRFERLSELGASYGDRFKRLGELGDLEKAIEYQSRAVSLTPEGHPDLPFLSTNLAASYGDRFRSLGELEDLEKAIECFSPAVSLTPEGHPDFPSRLSSLGASYADRLRYFGQLIDIEDAAAYALCVLELTPTGHPNSPRNHRLLAQARFLHFQHTRDPSLLHDSLQSFRNASRSYFGTPKDRYSAALHWASVTSNEPALSCIEAYQTAIDLLPQLIWLGATTHQRYKDLDQAKGLAASAASAAIRASEYGVALEWLEHGRCVVWNQHLMLRSPLDQPHSSHPSLADRLQTVSNLLHLASSETRASRELLSDAISPEQAAQRHRRLAEEYSRLLSAVRDLPGFEDFLRPMKTNRLVRAARYGPIVVINCYTDRCDALVVIPGCDHVRHVPLPRFTIEKAQRARSELDGLVRRARSERGVDRRPVLEWDPQDNFGSLLAILWYDIVNPVLDFLGYTSNISNENLPYITWCPTGPLTFLPLHAAGDYDRPGLRVFDYVVSSYTPTLTVLLASTPTVFTSHSRILAVAQEATSGHNSLPGTTRELSYVRSHVETIAQCTQLTDGQATVAAVLDAMGEHDLVHLACHAHQNVADPTLSGFFLHDDVLDLAKINRRLFKNKGLAFLSACQTAKGDKELPDEAIHLASGMLMAGYSSVVATMWSVQDADAPLVADRIYAQLMKDRTLGNGEAGRALHNAVAELRKEVGERSFGRWVPFIHLGS